MKPNIWTGVITVTLIATIAWAGEVSMEGMFAGGYQKFVNEISLKNDERVVDGKPSVTNYTISAAEADTYMTRSRDGASMEAGTLRLKVEGKITQKDKDGTPRDTVLSGILLDDRRDILSSWLISTSCQMKPTNVPKLLATFKQPIRTGDGEAPALPTRICLF